MWSRRAVLRSGAATCAIGLAPACTRPGAAPTPPDVRLTIAPHQLEIGNGVTYSTFAYNGSVPGPTIRLQHGRRTVVEVENRLATPELVHWHGLQIASNVDGAEEEGTPPVAPFSTRRYELVPRPQGTHWYHTHMLGSKSLHFGAYSGLFGFVRIEGGDEFSAYDREVLVAQHHWGSHWVDGQALRPRDPRHGLEVAYRHATMNGRLLGHGDPIRVQQGERVLFRILNASATEMTWTALAGHRMTIVGLDGVSVSRPKTTETLMLGPGERADVLVTMDNPGKWILGAVKPQERAKGMGVIVEYAGASGEARWVPVTPGWTYAGFAPARPPAPPDERIELAIGQIFGGPEGYNQWTLNGRIWPDTDRIRLKHGRRYRLAFKNETDEGHPFHLHRHHFEVATWGGAPCGGVLKDTINLRPRTLTELDFVADNPGPTLLHCHQAKHQDFGLMALLLYGGDEEPQFDPNAMHDAIDAAYCAPGGRRA